MTHPPSSDLEKIISNHPKASKKVKIAILANSVTLYDSNINELFNIENINEDDLIKVFAKENK